MVMEEPRGSFFFLFLKIPGNVNHEENYAKKSKVVSECNRAHLHGADATKSWWCLKIERYGVDSALCITS